MKESLLILKGDPIRYVFDLSIAIRQLVGLAYPYVPVSERSELVVKYLIDSLDNKTIQCHLLTADTSINI